MIPLDWMPALQALALLSVGAAVLAALLFQALRTVHPPWLTSLLAVIGLFLIAAALEVLKDHTPHLGRARDNPEFVIVRNAESLALVLIPLALSALRHPRLSRILAGCLGLVGCGLLLALGRAGVEGWNHEEPLQITATWIPGAWLLGGLGHVELGRWLWFAGSALMAWPTVRIFVRRLRRQPATAERGLHFVLVGLTLSSAAMAVFFWHQDDWADREYARLSLPIIACTAIMLALGEHRVASTRWSERALGLLGAITVLWMVTGAQGVIMEYGQFTAYHWLPLLQSCLFLAVPALLAVHLVLRAMNPVLGGMGAAPRRGEVPQRLE